MELPVKRIATRLSAPFRSVAGRLAGIDRVPTAGRAVLSHYARGGELDLAAIGLKSTIDEAVAGMVDDAFDPVEEAIAEAFDVESAAVGFDYETKLLRPAELTLGRLYREAQTQARDGFDPVAREVRPGLAGKLGIGQAEHVEPEFSNLVRRVDHAERVTELVVVALLDGDMRDAINDDEFEDFETALDLDRDDRRRVAGIAQRVLEADVEGRFAGVPDPVREAYDRAVDISEAHQDRDGHFRDLLEAARDGDAEAEERIREEYRDAGFEDVGPYPAALTRDESGSGLQADGGTEADSDDREWVEEKGDAGSTGTAGDLDSLGSTGDGSLVRSGDDRERDGAEVPAYFAPEDLELPYLRTQYGRVGVIYEGMIEMYREAGIAIDDAFERSIVLSIVGAQIWLDDVDDFAADMEEGQLTPVTAEYLQADTDAEAYRHVVVITEQYLDAARKHAVESGATLTAIAIEYIRLSGDPSVLPGSEAATAEANEATRGTRTGTGTDAEATTGSGNATETAGDEGGTGSSVGDEATTSETTGNDRDEDR